MKVKQQTTIKLSRHELEIILDALAIVQDDGNDEFRRWDRDKYKSIQQQLVNV